MKKPHFRYTNPKETIYAIPVGMDFRIEVVGDPENACYEWVIYIPPSAFRHSDMAYGSPEAALCEGLMEYLEEK